MNPSPQPAATASDHMMIDVLHRLRTMEQNIPPRVQNLEAAVSEIRKEFRDMREEQLEQAGETRAALNAFNKTLSTMDRDHRQDRQTITQALDRMGRKITFASGAFWAACGLFGLAATALYNLDKLSPWFVLVAGGPNG